MGERIEFALIFFYGHSMRMNMNEHYFLHLKYWENVGIKCRHKLSCGVAPSDSDVFTFNLIALFLYLIF